MINSWQYSKSKDKYIKKVSIKQVNKLNSMPFLLGLYDTKSKIQIKIFALEFL